MRALNFRADHQITGQFLRPVLADSRGQQAPPLPLGPKRPPRPDNVARLPPLSARAERSPPAAFHKESFIGRSERRAPSTGPDRDRYDQTLAPASLLAKDLRLHLGEMKRTPRLDPLAAWAPQPAMRADFLAGGPLTPRRLFEVAPDVPTASAMLQDDDDRPAFTKYLTEPIPARQQTLKDHACPIKELDDEEASQLMEHLRVLAERVAEHTSARNIEADKTRRLEEALWKETARNALAQADLEASRKRVESEKRARMEAQQRTQLEIDSKLGQKDMEVAEADRAVVESQLAKVRHEHAQALQDKAALRSAYAEEQPRLAALRERLTQLYVDIEVERVTRLNNDPEHQDICAWARGHLFRGSSRAATIDEVSDGGDDYWIDVSVHDLAIDELNEEVILRICA